MHTLRLEHSTKDDKARVRQRDHADERRNIVAGFVSAWPGDLRRPGFAAYREPLDLGGFSRTIFDYCTQERPDLGGDRRKNAEGAGEAQG